MGAEQSRTGAVVPGNGAAVPHGMSTLGPNLQKRFSKGIQYNMKVVIKGDRNVGKSCLFHRLQGNSFKDEYNPTQEIQVACIQWNYKVTDDVVKVEIWDIVDKGKVKKRDGLKMDTEEADVAPTLDAEFIDVYKGTSGVIMMLDITKYWTYEYVQRELGKVPLDIPVIIMASHRDMEHKRAVLTEEVQSFIAELERPSDAAAVYYMEASMLDGFGLKYLYRFFNVPFLELQRQTLLAQLRRNEEDLEAIKVELDVHEKSEEQDYDRFKEYLERKRKGLPSTGPCTVSAGANETADSIPSSEGTDVSELQDGTAMSLRSRLSQKVLQNTPLPAKLNPTDVGVGKQRIENFVPEGKLDTNFLAESNNPSPKPSPKPQRAKINDVHISDSDDEPSGNPQVTMDQESPDEDDMVVVYKVPSDSEPEPVPEPEPSKTLKKSRKPPKSSDEESYDDGYKPIDVMADEELPVEPESETKNSNVAVTEPSASVIDMGPSPLQPIDPTSVPRHFKPISIGDEDSSNDATSDEVISEPCEIITPDIVVINDVEVEVTPQEETNSITSLEDLTLSETIAPPPPPPETVTPVPAPQIDLDVLERISFAPPIAVAPPKKSPKTKKRSSPKRGQSPKVEVVPKKKVPPKKSLLDIQLTSSDEDDEAPPATESHTPEESVQVMSTYEEPEVSHPAPPKRLNSTGSLKLTHVEPISLVPVETPAPTPTPAPKKGKKKKREKPTEEIREKKRQDELEEKTADEIREKKERDELDDFFGGGEVTTTTREKPRKKKTKKKKPRTAANNPGVDEYEQF
ncbi:rab-like protein 6 isoform X2 [Bolinopsis microptera]|uniref:rab-like protein 6 isoform X2 n=1 Tax=Bolinopsis microptera TaxID=2820187 RepID=UPI003079568A